MITFMKLSTYMDKTPIPILTITILILSTIQIIFEKLFSYYSHDIFSKMYNCIVQYS